MTSEVPRWVRTVTLTAVSVVAGVAAVASYVHMLELADRAGESWRAWLVPLSVDGLLVAASMVLFIRRREGEKAGVLPWIGVGLGLIASLGANVAAGWEGWNPPWLSGLVAAWPPIALAVSFELLISVLRAKTAAVAEPADSRPKPKTRPEPEPPAPKPEPAPTPLHAIGDPKPWSIRAKQLMDDGVSRATAYRQAKKEFDSVSA